MKKHISILLIIILAMSFVSSTIVSDTDSTFENLNATNIYQNGNQVLDSGDTASLSVNYSSFSNSSTYWDGETSQANLNVNSSAYWDSLNSPSDITGLDSNNINDIYLFNTGDNATGNYDFDSGTLFIDSSGNYVGFGTQSPNAKVDVVGTGSTTGVEIEQSGSGTSLDILNSGSGDFLVIDTSKFVVDNAGNVGIGTASPSAKLDVVGNTELNGSTTIQNDNSTNILNVYDTSPLTYGIGGSINLQGKASDSSDPVTYARINAYATDGEGDYGGDLVFSTIRSAVITEGMRLTETGRVGIGTTSPSALTHIYRNYDSATTVSPVAFIEQDNSGDDQPALSIQQDGSGNYITAGDFVITDDVEVGIGITSPLDKLHIQENQDAETLVRVHNTDSTVSSSAASGLNMLAFGNNGFVKTYSDNHNSEAAEVQLGSTATGTTLNFITQGNERMEILATGEVNIADLSGTYTGGQAYVCVLNDGTIFASDSAC